MTARETMLRCEMKGYATIENAIKAAEKWFAKHAIADPRAELKVRWWTVIPTASGRFVPMLHCGDCPGGPGSFLGGPFLLVN
jgi:hypothetical protein